MNLDNSDDFKHLLQSGRISFLIGSGLSCPYLATLGDIENRLEELEGAPEGEAKEIIRASIIKEYFEKSIGKNRNLVQIPLDAAGKKTLRDYQNFLHSVNKIILLRRSSLLSKQVNLFTTNVDIFLEKALEEQNIEFNDGFTGSLNPSFELSNFKKSLYKTSPHYDNKSEVPIFNLFKLHGSVTWKLEKSSESSDFAIRIDNRLELLKNTEDAIVSLPEKCVISVSKEDGGNRVLKTIEELSVEAKTLLTDSPLDDAKKTALVKLKDSYASIPMINPTKEKFKFTTLNYTYYELLRMFSNELERENSILFVMGFSFADEHVREIVLRAINSNPTLLVYVFAFDNGAKEIIQKNLGFTDKNPKNNNLRIVCNEEDSAKNTLENINAHHFAKLADNLFKKDEPSILT